MPVTPPRNQFAKRGRLVGGAAKIFAPIGAFTTAIGSVAASIGGNRPFLRSPAAGMARARNLLELEEIPPQPIERNEP